MPNITQAVRARLRVQSRQTVCKSGKIVTVTNTVQEDQVRWVGLVEMITCPPTEQLCLQGHLYFPAGILCTQLKNSLN